MKGWLGFLVVLLVASSAAVGLAVMLSQDARLVRAVIVSATAAVGVQAAGFGCVQYLMGRKLTLFAAWGGAMGVRLVSLVIYALLVLKSPQVGLAAVAAPALMTFAVLIVVTSIVEPLFLNTSTHAQAA